MRKVFVAISGLMLLAVVLQFYFAAYGSFTVPWPITTEDHHEAFFLHSANADTIMVLSLLAMTAAFLAKAGWRIAMLALTPMLLVVLQIVIFIVAGAAGADIDSVPPVSTPAAHLIVAFHAVNALAVLAASVRTFILALKHDKARSLAPATA
ncbi:hypothetical protein Rhe02_69230 [Rhizocola hellebori]|uniref:Uncharacterized protein n=1 Tax=Rhizocola hellebori TaxID=1392758 RepID=A0A8J3QGG3_9ACTN|nr:DUF6220 domain-containing protein [Rhizocola hellebori]GIH08856.1 hypothetical protein Rhe02_69230 [Rhizocola hellebori]